MAMAPRPGAAEQEAKSAPMLPSTGQLETAARLLTGDEGERDMNYTNCSALPDPSATPGPDFSTAPPPRRMSAPAGDRVPCGGAERGRGEVGTASPRVRRLIGPELRSDVLCASAARSVVCRSRFPGAVAVSFASCGRRDRLAHRRPSRILLQKAGRRQVVSVRGRGPKNSANVGNLRELLNFETNAQASADRGLCSRILAMLAARKIGDGSIPLRSQALSCPRQR
jgi:hypothetical protein